MDQLVYPTKQKIFFYKYDIYVYVEVVINTTHDTENSGKGQLLSRVSTCKVLKLFDAILTQLNMNISFNSEDCFRIYNGTAKCCTNFFHDGHKCTGIVYQFKLKVTWIHKKIS